MPEFADTDRSILKIAYAISALDGLVTQDELKVFRKIAESFPGFCAGDETTNTLFTDSISIGDQLITLKKIYSDDEMLKALLSITSKDCEIIKQSHAATKKAFTIWIAVALADSDYSNIERKAIKALQMALNPHINLSRLPGGSGAIVGTVAELVFEGLPDAIVGGTFEKMSKNASPTDSDQIISDAFLAEVEDTLETIATVQSQMQTCNKDRYIELQKTYDELNATLKEMILSEDN